MANGAAFHKMADGRLGFAQSGGGVPAGYPLWKASTTWAAGAIVQNGNFIFSTVAGGAGAVSGIGPTPGALTDNACTWVVVGPCSAFAISDSVQTMPLGAVVTGKDYGPNDYGECEFRYVKFTGSADITAGDWAIIDIQAKTATQTPTASPGAGKVSIGGIVVGSHKLSVATPTYGFVMIRGVFDGAKMGTTFTAGCSISGIATAGACESKASAWSLANYLFDGAVLKSGSATGLCTVELYWPICSGR